MEHTELRTFEDYKAEHERQLRRMLQYDPGTIGASEWASAMADLEEAYPEWAERLDAES